MVPTSLSALVYCMHAAPSTGHTSSSTAEYTVLPPPPPYPSRPQTGPGSALLNAPAAVSSETYTKYTSTYHALDTYISEHSLSVTPAVIADFVSSSGSPAQILTHIRMFAKMELIPMPSTLASLNAKGLKKFKIKQDCSTALIPPALFPSILTSEPSLRGY